MLEDGNTNSEVKLTVWFLPGLKNDAPTLASDPNIGDVIPCLGDSKAGAWVYEFAKATDLNEDAITFSLDCPSLAADLFVKTVDQDQLFLTLNPTPMFDPPAGKHDCILKVSDSLGASTSYQAEFEVDCLFEGEGSDGDGDGEIPVPKIVSINVKGLITIEWSVDMKPTSNLEILTTGSERKRPIIIFLVPGSEYSLKS